MWLTLPSASLRASFLEPGDRDGGDIRISLGLHTFEKLYSDLTAWGAGSVVG